MAAATQHARPGWPNSLLVLLVLALVLRLGALAATPDYVPSGDPADYDRHAAALAATGSYPPTLVAGPGGPTALRPPAYPYLLAAAYELTGARWTAGRLLGVLLGVLTVGLVFLLADRLLGRPAARWAAGLAAIYPALVWLPAGLSAENLFLPLVLGAVLSLVALTDSGRLRWAAAAGGLVGLAALCRSNGLVLLLPALVAVLRLRSPAAAAALLATCALALAPWTIRNAAVFGAFLPLGTQSGYTIAGQYNPTAAREDAFKAAWRTPESVPALRGLLRRPGLDEAELDGKLRERGLRYAREHPAYVADVVGLNSGRLVDLGPGYAFTRQVSYTEMGIPPGQHRHVTNWLHLVLVLALAGLVALVRCGRAGPLWLWLAPACLWLSVVWLLGAPRYRLPLDPFLLLAAGAALAGLWARLRAAVQRSRSKAAVPG